MLLVFRNETNAWFLSKPKSRPLSVTPQSTLNGSEWQVSVQVLREEIRLMKLEFKRELEIYRQECDLKISSSEDYGIHRRRLQLDDLTAYFNGTLTYISSGYQALKGDVSNLTSSIGRTKDDIVAKIDSNIQAFEDSVKNRTMAAEKTAESIAWQIVLAIIVFFVCGSALPLFVEIAKCAFFSKCSGCCTCRKHHDEDDLTKHN